MPWVYDVPPSVAAMSIWPTIVGLIIWSALSREAVRPWANATAALASTILMVIVCVVRWWVKRKSIGSEDWLIFISLLCNVVYAAFTIIQTRYGLGLPVPLRPKNLHSKFLLYNYATRGPNIVAVALSKIALCIVAYKMIQHTTYKKSRWFIIGLATFTGAFWFALCMIEVFNCRPFMKVLDPSIPGYCIPYGPPVLSIWILNVFDDVLIYLLPIPLILRLNLDRPVKVGLAISFALGLFTTVFSILKITQVPRIVSGDHNSSLLVLYTTLEGNIGTMSASWPTIRVLVMRLPGLRNLSVFSGKTSSTSLSYRMTTSRNASITTAKRMEAALDDNRSEAELVDDSDPTPWERTGIMKTVRYDVESMSRYGDHSWK